MIKRTFILSVVASVILLSPVVTAAADPASVKVQTAPIYGSQLMTKQERAEYRAKLRSMKTQRERDAYRLEHHKEMQKCAKKRGVTLPDMPPAAGKGMGPGNGGMGTGGMGAGGGPNR